MPLTMTSTATSAPFAQRVADLLGVPLTPVERRDFPDGEKYLRLPLADRSGFIGHTVALIGATESQPSIDELYRLGCAAVKYGASRLVLAIPYFGYSTMERAMKPGEVVTAKTVTRQLSAMPHAPAGNWVVLMDLHASGIVYYFEGDTFTAELYAEPEIVKASERIQLSKLCLASADMGGLSARRRVTSERSRRSSSCSGVRLPCPGEGGVALLLGGVAPGAQAVLADAQLAGHLGDGMPTVGHQGNGLELELARVGLTGHRCPPASEFTPLTPTPQTLGNFTPATSCR